MLSTAFSYLFVTLIMSGTAHAWFRVACTNPLVQERVDPIVQPGVVPSQHVHTIHGASNFAPSATYDSVRASSCTSCEVTQDLSNYWFPKLYFHDKTANTYEEVANGGLLIYYQNRGDGDVSNGGTGLKAFPAGFRMISGNPALRTKKYTEGEGSQGELAERAIQWSCLRYTTNSSGYDGHGFPTTDCEAGFNARIHMPACWDGQNLDSPDHRSHMAFLSGLDNGDCPSDHPVYMMKLFYEVTWNVHDFASRWNVNDPTAWPFVYATGDPTGYSWHGDFFNGWDTTALQNAIDHCNNPNDQTGSGVTEACSYLTVQSATTANACKIDPIVNEPVGGQVLSKLPGCNPLQSGPGDATLYTDGNCPS
ncbi:hypothetical protein BV22DRAFT_1001996 [Leucogyrophana mollusca]|uniref:Uncharacterized protein n=1 Tax=Leucogyrophana mollusca TaxID=85980 RepID=A0ACB8BY59_9AGAM|nr:hypothetical protein BV22DRAFT_1001996 [Leucogyrophana mollusca]